MKKEICNIKIFKTPPLIQKIKMLNKIIAVK